MKAVITKLLFSQVSKFSCLKYIVTLITCKTGVMPKLAPEGEANSSDGLKHDSDEYELLNLCNTYLHTLITFVEDRVQVARLAEQFVLEDDIIQRYSSLAH